MPNIKRHQINPYLFLLAKEMLVYDFEGVFGNQSKHGIAAHIYNRYKSEKFASTEYSTYSKGKSVSLDTVATKKANSIYKNLIKPPDFNFSLDMLNQFVKEIKVLGTFKSWRDFVKRFGADPGAIAAEKFYMKVFYSELLLSQREDLIAWSKQRLLELHFQHKKTGQNREVRVIKTNEDFVIRTIDYDEAFEIDNFIRSCGLEVNEALDRMADNFGSATFILSDNYGTKGVVRLLPLDEHNFLNLTNEANINSLRQSSYEKKDVRYLFIPFLVYSDQSVLRSLLRSLEEMVSYITDTNELTICGYLEHPFFGHFHNEGLFLNRFSFQKGIANKKTENSGFYRNRKLNSELYQIDWNILKNEINHLL